MRWSFKCLKGSTSFKNATLPFRGEQRNQYRTSTFLRLSWCQLYWFEVALVHIIHNQKWQACVQIQLERRSECVRETPNHKIRMINITYRKKGLLHSLNLVMVRNDRTDASIPAMPIRGIWLLACSYSHNSRLNMASVFADSFHFMITEALPSSCVH